MFALNLDCSLGATGDWHTSGMNWSKLKLHDTKDSILVTGELSVVVNQKFTYLEKKVIAITSLTISART